MWKPEHRAAADRRGLRYESDLTDAEWTLVAPLIRPSEAWRSASDGERPRGPERRLLRALDGVPVEGALQDVGGEPSTPALTRTSIFSNEKTSGSLNIRAVAGETINGLATLTLGESDLVAAISGDQHTPGNGVTGRRSRE